MKKTKKRANQILKASEASALSAANAGRAERAEAREKLAESSAAGASCLRVALAHIRDAAAGGRQQVQFDNGMLPWGMSGPGLRIMANALRGMGYRVHKEASGPILMSFRIRWDRRPSDFMAGLAWDFDNLTAENL